MSFTIERLELHNFKRHQNLTVDFDDGLTVIRGPNWAGKSTVLNGVLFALFGTPAVPGRKDQLLRRGATSMFVKLWIRNAGGRFMIKRAMNSAGVWDESSEGARPVATGDTETSNWVLEQVGVDRKTALQLCCSPQTQTAALLSLGAAAINRLVEQLSGADQIDTMAKRAGERAKKLSGALEGLPEPHEGLEAAVAQLQASLQDLQEQDKQAATVFEAAKIHAKATRESWQDGVALKGVIEAAQAAQRRVEAADKAIAELQAEIAELEAQELPAAEDLQECEARLKAVRAEALKQRDNERERVRLLSWFETTGKQWEAAEAFIPEVEKLEAYVGQLAEAKEKRAVGRGRLATQLDQAAKRCNTLEKAKEEARCPECLRPYDEHEGTAQIDADIEQAKSALEEVRAELRKHDAAEVVHEKVRREKVEELNQLRKKLPPPDYEAIYNGNLAALEALPPADAQLAAKVEKAEAALQDRRRRQTLFEQWQDQLMKASKRMGQLLKSREEERSYAREKDTAMPDVGALEAASKRAQQKLEEAMAVKNESAAAIGEVVAELRAAEKALAADQAAREKRAEWEGRRDRWVAFQSWLLKNKSRLLTDLWNGILGVASEFIVEATGGYATELRRSEAGDFAVVEDGEESPCDGGISGGMAAIAGTGLKLALVELLPTAPGFLLLDEPSSELNDERAAALAGALRGRARQLVMVTHRTGEEFLADRLMELT